MTLQELPAADPIPDPVGTVDAARTAWASGLYTLAVIIVLLALARTLYYLAERYPTSRPVAALRLGSPRVRAALVGAISVLAALSVELVSTTGVNWQVVGGALSAAVALFMRPEPKGKPATVVTPTTP